MNNQKPVKDQSNKTDKSVQKAKAQPKVDPIALADVESVVEVVDNTELPALEPIVHIPTAVQDMAAKIQELLSSGKSLEEALAATVPAPKVGRASVDRVALIEGLTDISELKRARKIAYAKKSKAKDKPETLAKYQLEIDVATARLNEMIAEINRAETPWKKAIELGENAGGALQYFIADSEIAVDAELDRFIVGQQKTPSKADVKKFLNKTKATVDFVPETLRPAFNARLANRDQRVDTLARKHQAVADLKSGTRGFETKEKVEPKSVEPK